jgi:uncharacterized protein YndB with AHSA1/START domain
MWFDAEPVPLERIEELPCRIESTAILDASPARVFQIWAEGERQTEWFPGLVGYQWTTEHRGVGAERVVELAMFSVKERFLAWDPGKRMTFHIYAMTLPIAKALVEDLTFEPAQLGDDKTTRMRSVVRYDPTVITSLLRPIVLPIFDKMARTTAEALARYVKAHPVSMGETPKPPAQPA